MWGGVHGDWAAAEAGASRKERLGHVLKCITVTKLERPHRPRQHHRLTTGGTIEKTYDESDGSLRNVGSVLTHILDGLRLVDLSFRHVRVMSKDSLDMTDADRDAILSAVQEALP